VADFASESVIEESGIDKVIAARQMATAPMAVQITLQPSQQSSSSSHAVVHY
jgi:hypothetical protein